jgi:hypothetical protein
MTSVNLDRRSVAEPAEPAPSPLARPGFSPERLLRLARQAVAECGLDLSERHVVTEAATGAYAVTPVLAALGGASRVTAVTRDTRFGTVAQVRATTLDLASTAGVSDRIEVVEELTPELLVTADVVTNSGHVRPLDARLAASMKPTAVVPLMYEAWELAARASDVDVRAMRRRGVQVAGTNERHPHVDVFSYLGMMAVWQLAAAGVAVYRTRVGVLCDNDFAPYLRRGLESAGAEVHLAASLDALPAGTALDAVVVSLTPRQTPVVGADDAAHLARRWPGSVLAQYWGDVDRDALALAGVDVWPATAPGPGHMAVLPSDIGPDAIVRLQCGGLKVAEVLLRSPASRTADDLAYVDPLPADTERAEGST